MTLEEIASEVYPGIPGESFSETEMTHWFVAEVKRLRADAARYRKLRRGLYRSDTVNIGESYVAFRVIGVCPSIEEFDSAIDKMEIT